jgi:hypothetical protein
MRVTINTVKAITTSMRVTPLSERALARSIMRLRAFDRFNDHRGDLCG